MEDSDQDNIVKNSLKILDYVKEIYTNQTNKALAKDLNISASVESKKKSIKDNRKFFKQMFARIAIIMK